jgi:2-alkenal reductase
MNKKMYSLTSLVLIAGLFLTACSGISSALSKTANSLSLAQAASPTATAVSGQSSSSASNAAPAQAATVPPASSDFLSAYENALESIYTTVSPQVVNIMVVTSAANDNQQTFPGFNNPQSQAPQLSQALGSGFVWDTNGDIVTNNHVVNGASKIEVTFSDGTTVPATVVGTDPYSDLAVIKVNVSADKLHPVTMADSTQVKVGEIAIAIGNPFGFEGSMTVGNVSGIGRDIPTDQVAQSSTGATYSIPDVIQTDASINPGNSGGVLVNDQGQVIGVTYSLESASGSSSGIGFAIPSSIVSKVVPQLISNGKYDHPYLGISGITMTPDIAQSMNLPAETRGALVVEVTSGGPADKAGIKPSTNTVTINGAQGVVGGDVITAIDGNAVNSMSDIIAYLANNTSVGQSVTLTILRNGQSQNVQVTLGSRPSQ